MSAAHVVPGSFTGAKKNEEVVTFFWRRNRASIYKMNEVISVNDGSNLPDDGRSGQAFPSGEFIDICRIPNVSFTSQTVLPSYSQEVIQDEPTITGQTVGHSMVMREELTMKSDVKKSDEEGSSGGRNTMHSCSCLSRCSGTRGYRARIR